MSAASFATLEYSHSLARDIVNKLDDDICDFLNSIKQPHKESLSAFAKFRADMLCSMGNPKDNITISLEGLHQDDEPLGYIHANSYGARIINLYTFILLKELNTAKEVSEEEIDHGIRVCEAAIKLSVIARINLGMAIGANSAAANKTISLKEARSIVATHSSDIRHAENRQITREVMEWLEQNRHKYPSGNATAEELMKIVPFKYDKPRKLVTKFDNGKI